MNFKKLFFSSRLFKFLEYGDVSFDTSYVGLVLVFYFLDTHRKYPEEKL